MNPEQQSPCRVAVLSDTHGLLRPQVLQLCQGARHILHAGDVGNPAVLNQLATLAPVTAIRGNIDTTGPCAALPTTEMVEICGVTMYLVHSVADLDINPVAAGVRVVISGHSHKASQVERDGVLYLNPGSVGPRRFKLPVTMSLLSSVNDQIVVEDLQIDG